MGLAGVPVSRQLYVSHSDTHQFPVPRGTFVTYLFRHGLFLVKCVRENPIESKGLDLSTEGARHLELTRPKSRERSPRIEKSRAE